MSELSREEDLIAATILANQFYHDSGLTVYLDARASARKAMEHYGIRTALAGGGGGEKPCDAGLCERHGCKVYSGPPDCPTCGAPVCCQFCCYEAGLESRLAAAEKRAEEAERERHADRAALHVATASLGQERSKSEALARECGVALARVKELEAEQERIKSVWMNTDLTALISAINKVRDAAGAQP